MHRLNYKQEHMAAVVLPLPPPPPEWKLFCIYFLAHSVSQVMAGTLLHLNLANWLIIVERPRAAQSG